LNGLFTIIKGSKSKRSPAESNDVKEDDEVSGEDGDEIKPEWTGDHGCVFIYSFDESVMLYHLIIFFIKAHECIWRNISLEYSKLEWNPYE
jgi:hypothetical protein